MNIKRLTSILFAPALVLATASVALGQGLAADSRSAAPSDTGTQQVLGGVTEYDDPVAFDAATGPLTCITFEGHPHATFITTQYLPDAEFLIGDDQVLANDAGFVQDQFGLTPFYDAGAFAKIRIEFPTPVRSIGVYFPGVLSMEIFDVDGGSSLYTSASFGTGGIGFFGGVVSNAPFGYVELYRQHDSSQSTAFIDDICFSAEAECFLVVGDVPGTSTHLDDGHLFETQVGPAVETSFPVTLSNFPAFVLPFASTTTRGPGFSAAAASHGGPVQSGTPDWMLDGQFAVQVVMWNPQLFPGLPEQHTGGLFVTVHPDGSVSTVPYGTSVGGLELWHELGTDSEGRSVISFPFSIPGF